MATRVLGLAVAVLTASSFAAAGELPAGSLYLEPLQWTDDTGAPVELSDFRGQPVALTMFYSECRSTCPITLAKLRAIDAAFALRKQDVQIVLVSYDSRRDLPRQLARFRRSERLPAGRWHLLSGSPSGVARLAGRIGLGSYVDLGEHVVHSFRILLLDGEGVARGALDARHSDVASLFQASGPGAVP